LRIQSYISWSSGAAAFPSTASLFWISSAGLLQLGELPLQTLSSSGLSIGTLRLGIGTLRLGIGALRLSIGALRLGIGALRLLLVGLPGVLQHISFVVDPTKPLVFRSPQFTERRPEPQSETLAAQPTELIRALEHVLGAGRI